MNKADLAVALAHLRMSRLAEANGLSPADAKQLAERTIREQGVQKIRMLGTPEGSIITIVETHLSYVTKRCVDLGGAQHFPQANMEAIAAIEAHRSRFGAGGASSYPSDIDDYVFYRIDREIRHEFGVPPEQLGFDRATTKVITHTAKGALTEAMLAGREESGGSKACFVATACFGTTEHGTVVVLRRYRDKVLRQSFFGRQFIYWYYRISPPASRLIAKNESLRRFIRPMLTMLSSHIAARYRL